MTVLMGALDGVASPASGVHPVVGRGGRVGRPGRTEAPPGTDFEHAVLTLDGSVDGRRRSRCRPARCSTWAHRDRLDARGDGAAEVLLLGGEPFDEEIIMWWNFIGRSHDEIVAIRDDWMAGRRFAGCRVRG